MDYNNTIKKRGLLIGYSLNNQSDTAPAEHAGAAITQFLG